MTLSQKKRNFTGIITIGLLLIFCMLISPGLIVFDAQNINFLRAASASSYQKNPQAHLKPFDHITLTWAGNPATTQAATWRSRVDDKKSVAEIAAAKASPDLWCSTPIRKLNSRPAGWKRYSNTIPIAGQQLSFITRYILRSGEETIRG
jgi:hypothetical protein